MRSVIGVIVMCQLARRTAVHALPQSGGSTEDLGRTLGNYMDAILNTDIAGGTTDTVNSYNDDTVVNADWFGSYTVDFDSYPQVESGASEPAGTRRSVHTAPMKRAGPSILTTSSTNSSSGAGYLLRLDPRICSDLKLGTWNDPLDPATGNSGPLSDFVDSYTTASKSNEEWIDWTRQNILVIIHRFLALVDSTKCPIQAPTPGIPQFTIGKSVWESNFIATANGLSASFGPLAGTILGIDATNATTTPQYNLAVGYVIATCNSIMFRLSATNTMTRYERILLNLFAQFAATLANTWDSCTDGASVGSDLATYSNSFATTDPGLQSIAAPGESGGTTITPVLQAC
ncbi:MAG: hypothetical protein M1828_000118 [Chrysothrix sp. TS-e1954]|nr:MAG: hypothetical protein M1828_000118 [Chrysothrix sp. TS-e1954]